MIAFSGLRVLGRYMKVIYISNLIEKLKNNFSL